MFPKLLSLLDGFDNNASVSFAIAVGKVGGRIFVRLTSCLVYLASQFNMSPRTHGLNEIIAPVQGCDTKAQ